MTKFPSNVSQLLLTLFIMSASEFCERIFIRASSFADYFTRTPPPKQLFINGFITWASPRLYLSSIKIFSLARCLRPLAMKMYRVYGLSLVRLKQNFTNCGCCVSHENRANNATGIFFRLMICFCRRDRWFFDNSRTIFPLFSLNKVSRDPVSIKVFS